MQRSQQKRITKEAMVLRYMRHSRNLSLNQAGELVGISGSAIAHIEQGRMDVSKARIETMLHAYRYTQDEYLEFFDGRESVWSSASISSTRSSIEKRGAFPTFVATATIRRSTRRVAL